MNRPLEERLQTVSLVNFCFLFFGFVIVLFHGPDTMKNVVCFHIVGILLAGSIHTFIFLFMQDVRRMMCVHGISCLLSMAYSIISSFFIKDETTEIGNICITIDVILSFMIKSVLYVQHFASIQQTRKQSVVQLCNKPEVHLQIDEHFVCPICLDQDHQDVSTLSCHHSFHTSCINQWMEHSLPTTSCPICRRPIENT